MLSGTGDIEKLNGFPEYISDIPYVKYDPITSADIERLFSVYKILLRNNRSFKFVYIHKYIIIQCTFQGKNYNG